MIMVVRLRMMADITTLYSGACPLGWSRFTDLDARFAKGANTGEETGFSTGGATTHTHDYTETVSHSHTVGALNPTTNNTGSHDHRVKEGGGSGDTGLFLAANSTPGGSDTTNNSNHTHTFELPVHNTENTKRTSDSSSGVATGVTEAVGSETPYQEIIFCEKD